MIQLKEFYRGFQINYFDYKAKYLKHALENVEMYDLSDLLNSSTIELELAIKSDIRQNYFLALETLFTLIFCLSPDKHGICDDKNILKRIVKFKIPQELEKMALDEDGEDFLDKEINNGHFNQSLIEYIFYYCVTDNNFRKSIPSSLEAIRYGLHLFAKDFSDRREYNSYKHGLRSFPYIQSFSLSGLGEWDLRDSLTYYSEERKSPSGKGKINITTKVFDTQRDLKMTSMCSNFLWNIIKLRNTVFNQPEKEVRVLLFNKEDIRTAQKQNTNFGQVTYSVEMES